MQRFSDDKATVPQARLVMGLDDSKGGVSGKGSSVGNEDGDCGKKKRSIREWSQEKMFQSINHHQSIYCQGHPFSLTSSTQYKNLLLRKVAKTSRRGG